MHLEPLSWYWNLCVRILLFKRKINNFIAEIQSGVFTISYQIMHSGIVTTPTPGTETSAHTPPQWTTPYPAWQGGPPCKMFPHHMTHPVVGDWQGRAAWTSPREAQVLPLGTTSRPIKTWWGAGDQHQRGVERRRKREDPSTAIRWGFLPQRGMMLFFFFS